MCHQHDSFAGRLPAERVQLLEEENDELGKGVLAPGSLTKGQADQLGSEREELAGQVADTPSPSLLKRLLMGRGACSRI